VTDTEFARAFERLEVAPEEFNHRGHLRLASVYLDESPSIAVATTRMAEAIKRFAASVGKSDKYSEAVTAFWMLRLAAARRATPGVGLDELLAAHPTLLDSRIGPSHDPR
jgi:hypothetical protein